LIRSAPRPEDPSNGVLHRATLRLNGALFLLLLVLSVLVWLRLPEQVPIHFTLSGAPTRWVDRGAGNWVLFVAVAALAFGQGYLVQRFLVVDPDSTLLNVPHKDEFRLLPVERRIPVLRRMNRMVGLINSGVLLTFLLVLLVIHYSARNADALGAGLSNLLLLVLIGALVALPFIELGFLRGMIRRKLREEGIPFG
jgi:uncharacterized membrane protein